MSSSVGRFISQQFLIEACHSFFCTCNRHIPLSLVLWYAVLTNSSPITFQVASISCSSFIPQRKLSCVFSDAQYLFGLTHTFRPVRDSGNILLTSSVKYSCDNRFIFRIPIKVCNRKWGATDVYVHGGILLSMI